MIITATQDDLQKYGPRRIQSVGDYKIPINQIVSKKPFKLMMCP